MTVDFADYERMIFKVIRTMRPGLAHPIRDTDEYSECCLAFARCRRDFRKEFNCRFSTYLHRHCQCALLQLTDLRNRKRCILLDKRQRFSSERNPINEIDAKDAIECAFRSVQGNSRHTKVLEMCLDGISLKSQAKFLRVSRETARLNQAQVFAIARDAIDC